MRRWLVVVVGIAALTAGLAWWLLRGSELSQGTEAAQSAADPAPTYVAPKWSQPISVQRGARRLEGRVTLEGNPVAGATVTALANHGDDVLSDLPCGTGNPHPEVGAQQAGVGRHVPLGD